LKAAETNTTHKLYKMEALRKATNGFSDANKIGKGGFGVVYRVIKQFI